MAGTVNAVTWPNTYRPTAGKFGELPDFQDVKIGTAGYTIGNAGTTSCYVPTPDRTCQIRKCSIAGPTAAGSTGTVTAQFIKRTTSAAAPADVNITAATSIKSDVLTATGAFNWTVTATSINAVLVGSSASNSRLGDVLRIDVVASGTISTQPDLIGVVEYSIIE